MQHASRASLNYPAMAYLTIRSASTAGSNPNDGFVHTVCNSLTRHEPDFPYRVSGDTHWRSWTLWGYPVKRRRPQRPNPDRRMAQVPSSPHETRSKLAPPRFRRVCQVKVDWPHARDRYDRWLVDAFPDPVVVGRASDPTNEGASRCGHGGVRCEIFAARHIPRAGQHHAKPVGLIPVGRAHVARMPADEDEILPGCVCGSEHRGRVRHAAREIVERLPRNLVRPFDDGHGWVDPGRSARANAERQPGQRKHRSKDEFAPAGLDGRHIVLPFTLATIADASTPLSQVGLEDLHMMLLSRDRTVSRRQSFPSQTWIKRHDSGLDHAYILCGWRRKTSPSPASP